jgi:hypothetical protein
MNGVLAELQAWYLSNCDGYWEHECGVQIETLDNPGWSVQINLLETELAGKSFDRLDIERSDDDWLTSWVEENTFNGACGPENLEELLRVFLVWSKTGN